jgi:hypothetical protein
VITGDGVTADVLDAFTYGDSDNGYKGGLSGNLLKSELRVLALDGYTGDPIPGASVIAGSDLATAIVKKTSSSGVVVLQDANLGPKRSVTVAAKCYQPITFVDVPVDTVTAYLDPVLSPACASEGDPPPTGGNPSSAASSATSSSEERQEFEHSGWTNVPTPMMPDEAGRLRVSRRRIRSASSNCRAWLASHPRRPAMPVSGSATARAPETTRFTRSRARECVATPPYCRLRDGIAGASARNRAATADVFIR